MLKLTLTFRLKSYVSNSIDGRASLNTSNPVAVLDVRWS